MGLEQLTEHVYYLPHDAATDRPVLGYVRGQHYAVAIDAGNSQKHVLKFYDALAGVGFALPAVTAITHWHWDHTFGMHAVEGKTVVCGKTQQKLREVAQWAWSEEAMAQRLQTGQEIEFCDTNIRLEYPDRTEVKVVPGDVVFEGRLTLELGGVQCILLEVPSPHTQDCTLVLVPQDKVLFVADADCEDFYHGAVWQPDRLAAYLAAIRGLDFAYYVLGHAPYESKADAVARLETQLAELQAAEGKAE